jgi:hypothetical protein
MAKVRVIIEFEDDGGEISRHESEITARARSSRAATERQAQQTFADLQKDLILGTFFDTLPDPDGLYKAGSQRFSIEEVFSSSYFDQVNAQSVWLEIQNTLINVRYLLACARSYKELEPLHEDDLSKNGLLYKIHFSKMTQFDLSVFKLTKAEDLLLRLVFEATGAAFVSTGTTNWDRQLVWDRVKDRLKDRASNARLSSMEDAEYDNLLRLIRKFRNPSFVGVFQNYRDRVAHRISPSVDYPELYTTVDDRAWSEIRNPQGRVVGRTKGFAGTRSSAEFQFHNLYEVAQKTFHHYLQLLWKLRQISILDPPVSSIK